MSEVDTETLSALSTKRQTAEWVGVSTRQIDLQVKAARFPQLIRIGRAPRWRRSDLLEWLDSQDSA